ncbi:NAD(+) diphosphatase [Paenarthrobacter sp. Z7-10]|uniref:NAD(+) diphosphatase n=1 Tax=Paenarthrobacter sp. Z7-10 TaxID=2787635 RepID=UPI0022A935CB|nr:NAD(+) diphosphatase [Paenarthrobacter sp. Z7-10]MCZ2403201.1 NAD(+) diphosphatase [Paenarthrobacter sp. Z7-10]
MSQVELLPWSEAVLDRATERRMEEGFLDHLLAGSGARAMVLAGGRTLIRAGGIVYLDPDRLPAANLTVFLGSTPADGSQAGIADTSTDDGTLRPGSDVVLLVLSDEAAAHVLSLAPAGTQWAGFREAALELNSADSGIFIEANAIANWHLSHTHCPRCGTRTEIETAGWVRRCPADNSQHFPRTDPAIIVAVVGPDDRILLGGGSNWDANRYSTLAGFVEPGESLEQAVVREIAEEVGVEVHTPRYLGSQAWPFPASLMLGFIARTEDTVATPDGVEVTRARWFSRSEIQDAVSRGEVVISTRTSIARALIEHWYGGRIEDLQVQPVAAPTRIAERN